MFDGLYHCFLLATIDFDGERLWQTDVTNVFCLLNSRQFVENFLSVDTVASESIDGEVANAKRGEVLEEVRALARVNLEAVQACLNDNLGGTNL